MKNLISSATRLCLLAFTAAIIAALFLGKLGQDQFMTAALMVFTAFFAMKSSTNDPSIDNK